MVPLNPDGTINFDRLNYETLRDQTASAKKTADTSDLDKQIAIIKKAMKEASGFKHKELEARLQEAEAERASRIEAAQIGADASRYSADQSLAGTKYASDNSLKGTQYSADRSLEGTKYASDRSLEGTKYSSDNSLRGTIYGADSSAASSRYSTDADLYKFAAEQPLKRGEQALGFLKTYTDLSSRPDSFIQASNYARLGTQTEGMPGMLADLLGNVNPNGVPVGGNVAFRSGTGAMPLNAGQAIFGDNPLNLGTRAPDPAMPVWTGPQGAGGSYNPGLMSGAFTSVGSYTPSSDPNAHRGRLVGTTYGAQGGLPSASYGVAAQPGRAVASGQDLALMADSTTPRIMATGQLEGGQNELDLFKAGTRELMARGAHRWGNQALERMTSTERDMLASGIKDAGGVPGDYFEAYARSRIGNEGAGRAL